MPISIKGRICFGVVFVGNGNPETGDKVLRILQRQRFGGCLLTVHGHGS
ncbi:MAG: hypothetical protein M0P73_13490 [Syntrophobacterales bacterium]|nr:hypothetical protein [Syntrophobacterales bacterium]